MSDFNGKIAIARKAWGKPGSGSGCAESAGSPAVGSPFAAVRQPSGKSKPKVAAVSPHGGTPQLPAFDDTQLLESVAGLATELQQLNVTVREQADRIMQLEAQCVKSAEENAAITAQVSELTDAVNDLQPASGRASELGDSDGKPIDFSDP